MTNTDPPSLPYLAGLFDGEGSISLSVSSSGINLIVQVEMTDAEAVKWFHEQWGGSYLPKQRIKGVLPQHRDRWVWRIAAKKAVPPIAEMLPYLRVKKAQARLALEFQALKSGRKGKQRLSADEENRYVQIANQMSLLNCAKSARQYTEYPTRAHEKRKKIG